VPTSCNISFDAVPISDHPLTQYSGAYQTNTQWWGDFFSPLFVKDDGTISFGQAPSIPTVSYNATTATVSFDWTQYRDTTFKATFSFVGVGDSLSVQGGLNPRQVDGQVAFSGNIQALYAKPSLTNIRAFDSFMKDGDVVDFRSQPDHLPLSLDDQKRLHEAPSGTPTPFTVRMVSGSPGFLLQNPSDQTYLGMDMNGQVFCNYDSSGATVFHIYICMDGDIMIGQGDPSSPSTSHFMKRNLPSGLVTMNTTNFLNADYEYLMSFPNAMAQQPANRLLAEEAAVKDAGIFDPLPCEIVNCQIVAHLTVGFLPALGLGQFTWTSQISEQFTPVFQQYFPRISGSLAVLKTALINATSDTAGKAIFASAVGVFCLDLYTNAPDMINKFLRIVWESLGFFDYAWAAAQLALILGFPQGYGWAKVVANLTIWVATAYNLKQSASRCI